jgi:hypothetical protein
MHYARLYCGAWLAWALYICTAALPETPSPAPLGGGIRLSARRQARTGQARTSHPLPTVLDPTARAKQSEHAPCLRTNCQLIRAVTRLVGVMDIHNPRAGFNVASVWLTRRYAYI